MAVETRFATLYRRSLNKPWNPASLSRCVAGSSATASARMHLCTRRENTWTAGYRVAALLVGIFISSRFNCSPPEPGCNITAAEKSLRRISPCKPVALDVLEPPPPMPRASDCIKLGDCYSGTERRVPRWGNGRGDCS